MKAELNMFAAGYGVDELIVVTLMHDYEARRHSFRLLAKMMEDNRQ